MAAQSPSETSFDARSIDPVERGLIIVSVMLAALMQVLDTTIANVALPHMQTSLGATSETVNWVLTSYIVASAIALPITGWLSERIGRRPLFLISIVGFTVASALCAICTNLPEMVLFRILQGIFGAFIMPMVQAIMLDVSLPEKRAKAMAVYGGGIVIGPILGPVLGGWLTDNFNWRWVFLVNVPIGVICTLMLFRFLPAAPKQRQRFDLFGFVLLALALGSFQMMLDRGQLRDWFDSWEIVAEAALAAAAGWMFLVHMLTSERPLFELPLFADRNFVAATVLTGVSSILMMGGLALLPAMLQRLFGYSVLQAGLLTAPRGVGFLLAMLVAGRLTARADLRLLVVAGLLIVGFSLWQQSGFSLEMDSRPVFWSGIIQGIGLGFFFVPLNIMAFETLEARYRTSGASLMSLSRSMGGAIGVSLVTTLLADNIQVSHEDLAANITSATTPAVSPSILGSFGVSGEAVTAMVDAEINRQAAMIAYINDFHLMMVVGFAILPLVLLFKRVKPAEVRQMPAE